MKKGDIIRFLNKSGLPIGRFYMIDKIVGKAIWVTNNIILKPFKLSVYQNIKVYTKCVALVSESDFTDLDKLHCVTYYHSTSKQWDKIFDKQPEIIEFRVLGKKKRIFYKTDGIYRRIIDGKPCIRVYFEQRLFRPLI